MRLGDLDALALHLKGVAECYRKDNENSFAALVVEETIALDVMDFPSIDAVPVVRCKDCKHRATKKCPLVTVCLDFENCMIVEVLEQKDVGEEFFCSYGERRQADETK